MKPNEARAAIYSALNTVMADAHPGIPVLYENRLNVDLNLQTEPFVACELVWNDGSQIGMGDTPGKRYMGAIWLATANKQGEGTAELLAVMTTLSDAFGIKTVGGVTCQAPRPLPGYLKDGWYFQPVRIPFYFDDMA